MAQLVPYSRFRAVDDDGEPLVGGKLYAFAPGTSAPKSTYTDHTLGVAHQHPMVLDANGEVTFFIDGDTDLTLDDINDVQLWGPIRATDSSKSTTLTGVTLAGSLTVTSAAVTWSGNPTHSGNHTFSNNLTVNGNTTLGDANTDTLTVNSNAIAWPNNPTHSGNHTFSGTTVLTPTGATFTPGLTFGGNATGMLFVERAGRYQRLGNTVYFTIGFRLFAKGSSTGTALITGLPVTSATPAQSGCSIGASNMASLTGPPVASVNSAASTIALAFTSTVATGAQTTMDDTYFTGSSIVTVSGSYQV